MKLDPQINSLQTYTKKTVIHKYLNYEHFLFTFGIEYATRPTPAAQAGVKFLASKTI